MSDNLEKEIEELLKKIDDFPSPESASKKRLRLYLKYLGNTISIKQQLMAKHLGKISLPQLMLGSFILIFTSYFILGRINPLLMRWVLFSGIILFLTSFTLMFFSRGHGSAKNEQIWRGKKVNSSPKYENFILRITKWMRKRS
ncbi:MAG: hypothetical protein CL792_02335 [Chloroflexi bacterium]|nr:hypothetical protein [Chloroflexota bacterium]|tara:strand:- start:914 stop:1342 length:429 start_codon:yes stop_codon:yes gene_type:complete